MKLPEQDRLHHPLVPNKLPFELPNLLNSLLQGPLHKGLGYQGYLFNKDPSSEAGHPHFASEGAAPEPRTAAGDVRFSRDIAILGLRAVWVCLTPSQVAVPLVAADGRAELHLKPSLNRPF